MRQYRNHCRKWGRIPNSLGEQEHNATCCEDINDKRNTQDCLEEDYLECDCLECYYHEECGCCCCKRRCKDLIGPTEAQRMQGPIGLTGATGAPCSGSIIPYASGPPVTLTTIAGGLAGNGVVISNTVAGLTVPVTAQTRLLLVVRATASGISLINTVTGYISEGISIS